MRNFTAFCLLALGAAAVKIESQGSFDDSLTQLRSDGLEFVSSIADAIEEAQDSDEGSDRDERLSSSSEDESDDEWVMDDEDEEQATVSLLLPKKCKSISRKFF